MPDITFKATDAEGNEILCTALLSFENGGKLYIVFSGEVPKSGESLKAGAAKVDIDAFLAGGRLKLEPIETEAEWKLIRDALDRAASMPGGAEGFVRADADPAGAFDIYGDEDALPS